MSIWKNPAAIDRLKALHTTNISFRLIAIDLSREFGPISKNAVIGKASRLGLKVTADESRARLLVGYAMRSAEYAKQPKRPKREAPERVLKVDPIRKVKIEVGEVIAIPIEISAKERVIDGISKAPQKIIDADFGGCRWPLYRPAEDGQTLFCCNVRGQGQTYCRDHNRLAYQSVRTAQQIAADAKTRRENTLRSGAMTKATHRFNLAIGASA